MNFMEAIKAIEDGKKVRRQGHVPIMKQKNSIMSIDGAPVILSLFDYKATDWDILEDIEESVSSEEIIKRIKNILEKK